MSAVATKMRRPLPDPARPSGPVPMAIWLRMGPGAKASLSVTIVGTTRSMAFDAEQIDRLGSALDEARRMIRADDGERRTQQSYKIGA